MQKIPKIVLLDNNDSFTYNWVELLRQTTGAEPVVIKHDYQGTIPEGDAYIFSPGPGLPKEKPLMLSVMQQFGEKKPILGICLGIQFIAEFYGCKLFNLGRLNHGLQVEITAQGNHALFESIPQPFFAALYHSWAIDPLSLAPTELNEIAHHQDMIMALAHSTLPIVGFQFHPESFLTEVGQQLILNWLDTYVYPKMTSSGS